MAVLLGQPFEYYYYYYCLLPLVFDFLRHYARAQCIVVIVSPLIALMQDQVRAMRERGVSAVNAPTTS